MKKRSEGNRSELTSIAELAGETAKSAVLKGVPSAVAAKLAEAAADNAETMAETVRSFLLKNGAAGERVLFDALDDCPIDGVPFSVVYLDEQRKTIKTLASHSPEERRAARRIGEKDLAESIQAFLKVDPRLGRELLLRELKAQKVDIPELFAEQKPALLKATPYVWTDPATIPKRQWLYGRQLIRGFMSLVVAPGGVGKSSLTIVEALAMVTGRPLVEKQSEGKLRVWLFGLEDPADELKRRVQAACEFYDISAEDIGDRLFVDSGRVQGLCVAETDARGRTIIIKPVVEALVRELRERKIDVLVVDPFVSSHQVSENDNNAIDRVAKLWGSVADICGCAIQLVHHTKKLGSDAEVTAESSRGGKALTDASRVTRVINRMSAAEGKDFGITKHRNFFRVYDDKSNMAPPPDISEWYELVNTVLPNGDHVGVVARWMPPDAFDGVSVENLKAVQRAISVGDFREDIRSREWAGNVVAEVLKIDIGSPPGRTRVKQLLSKWVETGALRVELQKTEQRKQMTFIRVGEWV